MEKQKKKGKKNNYFDIHTEEGIIEFQKEIDLEKQKEIFVLKVQPSFAKLIENIIFVYKFHALGNIDILKNDCMSFLFENIYKFDGTKGHKAFSYFNVIAKHWFIQKVKVYKKRNKLNIHFDKTLLTKLEKNNNAAVIVSYEDTLLKNEFFFLLKEEVEKWREKFDKHHEKKVLEAVIVLLNSPDLIELYNKKGIYLYIREMTGLSTKQVVTNLLKFRKKYNIFKKKYFNGEI